MQAAHAGIHGFGSQSDRIALCVDEEFDERGVAAIQVL